MNRVLRWNTQARVEEYKVYAIYDVGCVGMRVVGDRRIRRTDGNGAAAVATFYLLVCSEATPQ